MFEETFSRCRTETWRHKRQPHHIYINSLSRLRFRAVNKESEFMDEVIYAYFQQIIGQKFQLDRWHWQPCMCIHLRLLYKFAGLPESKSHHLETSINKTIVKQFSSINVVATELHNEMEGSLPNSVTLNLIISH